MIAMLSQLYIENIAVIEKVSIDFHSGLNVLTGETGAGKSIVIDSIHAVLGERTSRELVRTGARSAFVSAVFTDLGVRAREKLEELGYCAEEDGTVMIQREIHPEGKTACRVNGRPATVSVLKEIGSALISIHGQHENYDLLSPDLHIRYLDRMGVPEALLEHYRAAFGRVLDLKRQLSSCRMNEEEKARRTDLLTYQIKELEDAGLRAGEQEELDRQRTMYLNSEKIAAALAAAKDALDGGEETQGALAALSGACTALSDAERFLPELHTLAERMQNMEYELEDCGSELREFSSRLEYDPQELEEIEARLDQLYRLGLKYGGSAEQMLAFLEKSKEELKSIEFSEENFERLNKEYREALKTAEALAEELSKRRRKTAALFTEKVKQELRFLDMPNITFEVRQEKAALNQSGCDQVEFLISVNPGEPARPIARIASGGELSRIMLAIKTVLAGKDDIGTLIFDEIDTGISGSAAQKVGLKLHEVAENRQVICVTHLAQIAAIGDTHYLIEKHVRGNKTFTDVAELDEEGRKRELARIMGGAQVTPLMLENAAEMLRLARRKGGA